MILLDAAILVISIISVIVIFVLIDDLNSQITHLNRIAKDYLELYYSVKNLHRELNILSIRVESLEVRKISTVKKRK